MHNGGYRACVTRPRRGLVSRAKKGAAHEFLIVMVFCPDKRQRPRKVHQLVCEAFHGERPFLNAVVIHKDENALNNRPENLKWGTQKENLNAPGFIAYRKSRTGERASNFKYTDAVCREVRDRAAAGERKSDLAREFGMSSGFVSDIANGKRRTGKESTK